VNGSHEEFIAEHYWGYTAQRDASTVEYRVTHPSWRVAPATTTDIDCDYQPTMAPPSPNRCAAHLPLLSLPTARRPPSRAASASWRPERAPLNSNSFQNGVALSIRD
jgi:hypothetical protein